MEGVQGQDVVVERSQEELDRERDMALRQAHLAAVDAIERRWGFETRTSELLKLWRAGKFGRPTQGAA